MAQRGIPVLYYIAPQVWAWHPGRLKKIRRRVRKLFVILPFEAVCIMKPASTPSLSAIRSWIWCHSSGSKADACTRLWP